MLFVEQAALLAQATSVTREYLRNIVNVEVLPPEATSGTAPAQNLANAPERASYITPLHIASAGMKLLGVRDMSLEAAGHPLPSIDAVEHAASQAPQRGTAAPAPVPAQATPSVANGNDGQADASVQARMSALGDLQRAKQSQLAAHARPAAQ